jgi:hypothetical protein
MIPVRGMLDFFIDACAAQENTSDWRFTRFLTR